MSVSTSSASPSLPRPDTRTSAWPAVAACSAPAPTPQKLSSCSSLILGSTAAHGSPEPSLYRTGVFQKSSCGCLPGDISLRLPRELVSDLKEYQGASVSFLCWWARACPSLTDRLGLRQGPRVVWAEYPAARVVDALHGRGRGRCLLGFKWV